MAATQKPAPGAPQPQKRADARPNAGPGAQGRPDSAARIAAAPPASMGERTRAMLAESMSEKRPYLRFAFANPYNLSLLAGAMAASALTLNPLLALVALGGEGLWMLYAPESKLLRRLLWDPRIDQARAALEAQQRAARVAALGPVERERVQALVDRQQEIRRLAATNPSFTGELLRTELMKTDRLVEAFIDMAITCARYEQYLQSVDVEGLDADRARWERAIQADSDNGPQTTIAKKNLAIILRRLEKMKEIGRYLTVARGQLDLIENSFQLLADQIVTMQSPQQLSGQLDELLDGVEAIRQTALDTEQMLNSIGIGSST